MPIGFPVPTLGQQWPTLNPTRQWDGTKWFSINTAYSGAATPVVERVSVVTGTMDFIVIDNDAGGTPKLVSATSLAESVGGVIEATSPAALLISHWTAEPTLVSGEVGINIITIPSDGGSPITGFEYRVGTGGAIALTGLSTGLRVVTSGFIAGIASDIQVRAVNAIGAGAWSDIKTRTPLASGGSFTATYAAHAMDGNEFQNPKVFSAVGIGAADATRKVYVYFFTRGPATTDPVTLSVNGGAVLTPIAVERDNGNRQVLLFVADVPTGTTADFSFSATGMDFNNGGIATIRVVGAHTAATSPHTMFGTTNGAINTNAGDTIFSGVIYGGDWGANFFDVPTGFTEHFEAPTRPSIPAQPCTLRSGVAVGGAPESFPGTVADAGGTSEIVLRLRAV